MPTPAAPPTFSFTIEEVFYIKPPVDRVIFVGTATERRVRVGESLMVRCQGEDVPVVLDGIETFAGQPAGAEQVQQVGLKLAGIRKAGRKVILEPIDGWPDTFLACLGSLDEEIPRLKQGVVRKPSSVRPSRP